MTLAADVLEFFGPHGEHWLNFAPYSGSLEGMGCLLTAGSKLTAFTNRHPFFEYVRVLREVIIEQFPERLTLIDLECDRLDYQATPIAHFNDHSLTTFNDIRMVLEKTDVRMQEDGA